jgi:c-di-GMP-binding flagellar brake protein YcgR
MEHFSFQNFFLDKEKGCAHRLAGEENSLNLRCGFEFSNFSSLKKKMIRKLFFSLKKERVCDFSFCIK